MTWTARLQVDDDLIAAHGNLPALMPYVHLPVQSGSDRILAAMNRRHTRQDYLDVIAALRAHRADLAFTCEPHLRALIDSGGNGDRELPPALFAPRPPAVLAGMRHDPALAPAAVAHGDIHELPEDALLGSPDLAASPALRAALWLGARLGA